MFNKRAGRAKETISAETFLELARGIEFPPENEDLLIASKVQSIRFRKFYSSTQKMIHGAVLAPHF